MLAIATIAMWVIAIVLHPTLPQSIPLHFDIGGMPDRFGPPTFSNWFLLPVIGTATALLMVGLTPGTRWLLRTVPGIVNVPRKDELLALPLDAQRRALAPLSAMLDWISILIVVGFAAILVGTERVANGAWKTLPSWPLLGFIPLLLGVVLVGHLAIRSRIRTETLIQTALSQQVSSPR